MAELPNFYAILPSNVRYEKRICANAKLLYAEITALTQKEGYCFASNSYFSGVFDTSKRSITRWISELKKIKLIEVETEIDRKTKQVIERKIFIFKKSNKTKLSKAMDKNIYRGIDKNGDAPIDKNGEGNTTRKINTTRKGIDQISKKTDTEKFINFWAKYPRKKGKIKAEKIFKKLEKENKIQLLETCLKNYLQEIENDNIKTCFIMHCSTFLNGRYIDYKEVEDNGSCSAFYREIDWENKNNSKFGEYKEPKLGE